MRFGQKTPKLQEKRSITRFAWVPTQLSDGTYSWLEKYMEAQTYTYHPIGCAMWVWTSRVPAR